MLERPLRQSIKSSRYLLIGVVTGLLASCGGSSGDSKDIGKQDLDGDSIINELDADDDGDGIIDNVDSFVDRDRDGLDDLTGLTAVEAALQSADLDQDGIINSRDPDADGDGIDDAEDNFVDLDQDGRDDVTQLTQAEINPASQFIAVSATQPCGSEAGTDNSSSTPNWNDNCVVKRSSEGGQFADSLFSVGIQRVLFCSGYATTTDFTQFADGEFGPASETALKSFQRDASLVADGIVGPNTWARLQNTIELLEAGQFDSSSDTTLDTYGFKSGVCADIPLFYQQVTLLPNTSNTVEGGWTLARNQPNQSQTVPFSYETPFGKL